VKTDIPGGQGQEVPFCMLDGIKGFHGGAAAGAIETIRTNKTIQPKKISSRLI
jgi:hypothetical protein